MTRQSPERKVALVTGASGEIGRAVALRLAQDVSGLALTDIIAPEGAAAACRDLLEDVLALPADVCSEQDTARMVEDTVQHFGCLHIVVNVAGICLRTSFDEIGADEWDQVLAVNLKGPFLVVRAALPSLRRAGWGRVVNIASLAGQTGGIAVGAHYAASKAGLVALTKAVARIGAARGITANAVAPGVIDTAMTQAAGPQQVVNYLQSIPLGKMGEPDDVAEAVAFLCSEAAGYITGSTLDVNGGMLMRG